VQKNTGQQDSLQNPLPEPFWWAIIITLKPLVIISTYRHAVNSFSSFFFNFLTFPIKIRQTKLNGSHSNTTLTNKFYTKPETRKIKTKCLNATKSTLQYYKKINRPQEKGLFSQK
jgi:hypothetical protein